MPLLWLAFYWSLQPMCISMKNHKLAKLWFLFLTFSFHFQTFSRDTILPFNCENVKAFLTHVQLACTPTNLHCCILPVCIVTVSFSISANAHMIFAFCQSMFDRKLFWNVFNEYYYFVWFKCVTELKCENFVQWNDNWIFLLIQAIFEQCT